MHENEVKICKCTWEATNEHSTTPASPLRPRRQASANFTAAYACNIKFSYSGNFKCMKDPFFTVIVADNQNLKLTIESVAEPAPAFACKMKSLSKQYDIYSQLICYY